MKKLSVLMTIVVIVSCNSITKNDEKYKNYKSKFDPTLIKHFPINLETDNFNIVSNTNIHNHSVGLVLYEYNVSETYIDSIVKSTNGTCIGSYKGTDTCLLIVNRFETVESDAHSDIPTITDNSLIEKSCYQNLKPIPNFIDYSSNDSKTNAFLDSTFSICVIDAQQGNHYPKFNMDADPQMPIKWKNGYSRGFAFSKTKRTIIFWGIVW